jgi:hypothetical protein
MDSVWFAVDADGHVAALYTGEDGHIPTTGNGGYGYDVLDSLENLTGQPRREEDDGDARVLKLGLFCYDYPDGMGDLIEPYTRAAVPEKPLHIEQLSPALRKRFLPFPDQRFTEAEHLQPCERYECDTFNVDACAYLCADGKTVRPIPGSEEFFAEFVEEFRISDPEAASKCIFDGPLTSPEEDEES